MSVDIPEQMPETDEKLLTPPLSGETLTPNDGPELPPDVDGEISA